MAILNIVKEGDPVLRKVCRPVTEITPRTIQLLEDMKETLHKADGCGLAAPQVGILRRIFLVDVGLDGEQIVEFINPEILETNGEQEGAEGCLSVPGKYGLVKRPYWVKVRAQDRYGDWFEAEAEGLGARAFCHEIEHLDGHLYVEHIDHFLTERELQEYLEQEEAAMGTKDFALVRESVTDDEIARIISNARLPSSPVRIRQQQLQRKI